MSNNELNTFLKGFKEVKKKVKKQPEQMQFNLDLKLKKIQIRKRTSELDFLFH